MNSEILIILILLCLSVQVALSRQLPRMMGALLIAQMVYWTFSYVVRPVVLIALQPSPRFGDSLADQRISAGGYHENLPAILLPILWGLITYQIGIALIALASRRAAHTEAGRGLRLGRYALALFTAVYVCGVIARVTWMLGVTDSVIGVPLMLGAIGAGALVVYAPLSSGKAYALLSALVASEILWAIVVKSKTPIMALAVTLLLRFAWFGWTRRRKIVLFLVSAATVASFSTFHAMKFGEATVANNAAVAEAYPSIIRPLISIVTRFDLLSAMTDAVLAGPGQWLSGGEFMSRAIQSLVPQQLLGIDKITAGRSWAIEMSSQSQIGVGDSVSRAEGFIAEGYALSGLTGVCVGAVVFALLTWLVGVLLESKSALWRLAALIMVVTPILFERGLLGFFDSAGKGVQVILLVACIAVVVRSHPSRQRMLELPRGVYCSQHRIAHE